MNSYQFQIFVILWKITERDFKDPSFQFFFISATQTIESSVMISSSFSKISQELSPEQVDVSNSPTKSSFSFKDYELDPEIIFDYSTKEKSLPPLSSFTTLPSPIVVLSESVVSFYSFSLSFFHSRHHFYHLNLPPSQQGMCNMGILLLPYPRYPD